MDTSRRILITAFEPFDNRDINASEAVLEKLPDQIGGYAVDKILLPVVFGKAAERVLRHPADYVFLLGEAGERTVVTPELRAVNLREARIPDNEGYQPEGVEIIPGGPAAYYTVFPVDEIVRQMKSEGFAIEVSEDAGRFVCNDIYYLTGVRSPVPVSFIHVPAVSDEAAVFADAVRRFVELSVTKVQ